MARTIRATIDNRIRVHRGDLPSEEVGYHLVEALTLDNKEKWRLRELKRPPDEWKDLPDQILLWTFEDDVLTMPRGFRHDFEAGMAELGYRVEYDDQRFRKAVFRLGQTVEPRDHQPPAIEAIRQYQDLIYKAPTGSGKTITSLLAIRSLAMPSIIIVNTIAIAEQWVDRTHEALGDHYPVTIIGDRKFEISPYLTVATAQTLWARYDDLKRSGFFNRFGIVVLDECHHATARTFSIILDSFNAMYRWGVSATPEKTGDFRIAQACLGPVMHETPLGMMFEKGYLLKPRVVKVQSTVGKGVKKKKGARFNWNSTLKKVLGDNLRQDAIAVNIMNNQGKHQLVLSAQLGHLDDLERRIREMGFADRIFFLTGREDGQGRDATTRGITTHPGVIFSTIANEAVDIKILEIVHLAFPQKNVGLITQQIGRVMRSMEGKAQPVIFDYTDDHVPQLEAQWLLRSREVYRPLGIEVERVSVTDVLQMETA